MRTGLQLQAEAAERRLGMTFEDLCQREPQLKALLDEARAVSSKGDPKFCANRVWYGYRDYRKGFKHRMSQLVGTHRRPEHPMLSTSEAYDLAYRTLYDALPGCRHGGPFC